ncbi:hypothetical protein [Fodinibius roseus]|nr:hypothetical protein [Fodinibius roseus]
MLIDDENRLSVSTIGGDKKITSGGFLIGMENYWQNLNDRETD